MLASLVLFPTLAFLLITFYVPLAGFVLQAVNNQEISPALDRTMAVLRDWDRRDLPPDEAFSALATDLRQAQEQGVLPELARRLNYALPGFRSVIMRTARALSRPGSAEARQRLIDLDPSWGDVAYWAAIANNSGATTGFYFLAAVDLERDVRGGIVSASPERAIYVDLFVRTAAISLSVTVLCLLVGYPVAYVLANASARTAGFLMIFVLLPFWTSLLVRTTAWIVLLQNEGLINQTLRSLGIIDEPLRLLGTRFAVLVAMTHVLLPYMILPVFSVMKGIKGEYARAAANLGATPWSAFWLVYFPQTLPGVTAGSLLVFILALGYYVTPALVGGPSDQMISYFVALYTNESLNWGMAAALGTILLALATAVYLVFDRVGGLERMR